ncbi:hypothetical protein SAMN02745885_00645 [Carboxydocella sporoproducens DSM 16521]|uniref:Lipoprotein n=2 Tax=Carboxydocella TaxID=178898 RepID=A0A1T4MKW1_9FIRM|nr:MULTISPECIES: hypothetical protein [Carboxydocella]AVX21379.1 hypothetical protein CFE_2236 [Carboxydocella thermautotrophica]SJZ67730.1 hypothetical protein SAMN02745885_00645 [Carboxydocella sporoproducens DSM 16521]
MKKIGLMLLIVLILSGCSRGEKAYLETVKDYNETLAIALLRPQPELMTRIATAKEQSRILTYILYWQQKKKVIENQLLELKLEKTEKSQDMVVVFTSEKWRYRHLDTVTRKAVDDWRQGEYRVKYYLTPVKGDKRWLVDRVEILEKREEK